MDETDDAPQIASAEVEMKQVLGLFDVPAFARRGVDLEYALVRLRQRLGREREGMLEMVRLRLRQWASVATDPDDWRDVFAGPVAPLTALVDAESPTWSNRPAPTRRRRAIARDLAHSVSRFNRRWAAFVDILAIDSVNRRIDHYNRYYVLEKECVLGSPRLAARHFAPKPPLTRAGLLDDFPLLPAPVFLA